MPIENCKIHESVKIWQPELVNLYECKIGANSRIGAFVEIGKGVIIGNGCKIEAHSFIPEGVVIGNNVFIGPHTIFTNTKYPMGFKCYLETIVENYAVIGAGSTILPGIRIGANATIGAGSVVTKDVGIDVTVVGNPARPIARDCKYYNSTAFKKWCGVSGRQPVCKCEDYEI